MAVTKRTRFEVLRRDNHACRYCGAAAPDVRLTVDHVVPVALGGSDAPENLVAACSPCNSGKTSTGPDSTLVADVRADALRYAELTRQAYAVLVENMGNRDDYLDAFQEVYPHPLPPDWRNSLTRWFNMGVPTELVLDAARLAGAKVKTFRGTDRFTYMCGIVWHQVRLVGEHVAQHAALDGAWMTAEALTDAEIAAYEVGRDSEQRATTLLLAPGWVLDDFIDRYSRGVHSTTLPLLNRGA